METATRIAIGTMETGDSEWFVTIGPLPSEQAATSIGHAIIDLALGVEAAGMNAETQEAARVAVAAARGA